VKVFQTVPQPPNPGADPSGPSHAHVLDGAGCQAQCGHRIRANVDSSSRPDASITTGV
jgi:hypothetical protein